MLRFAGRGCGSGSRVWPFPATPGLRVTSVSWKLAPRERRGGPHCGSRRWCAAEAWRRSRSLRGRPVGVGVGGVSRLPNGLRVRGSDGPSAPRPDGAETELRSRPQVRRAGAPSESSRCGVARTGSRGDERGRVESAPRRPVAARAAVFAKPAVRGRGAGPRARRSGGDQARRASAWPKCSSVALAAGSWRTGSGLMGERPRTWSPLSVRGLRPARPAGSVGPRSRGERSPFPTRVSAGRRRRAHGLSARGPRSRSPACAEARDVRPGGERGRGPVSASAAEARTAPGDPRPAAASEGAL